MPQESDCQYEDVPDGQGGLGSSDPRPPSCTSASSDATLKAGVWDTSG